MNKKEWIKCIIFLCLILCSIILLSCLFIRKGDLTLWNTFYAQEEDSIDIVILGSSLLECGINPYQLAEETGATTFNLSVPAQSPTVHAAYIREVIKTQSPKLIIIESYRYVGTGRMNVDAAQYSIAGMKPSMNKLLLIAGLPLHGGKFNRLELLIPLLANHNRWESLTIDDLSPLSSHRAQLTWWNGGFKQNIYEANPIAPKTDEITFMDDLLYKCLVEVVQTAKENNVQLLFFNPPNPELTQESYGNYNAMYQYLDEQGIPWVECNYEPELLEQIDVTKDYCDYHHLNITGTTKTTQFLADYVNTHYDINGQFTLNCEEYHRYLDYMMEQGCPQ